MLFGIPDIHTLAAMMPDVEMFSKSASSGMSIPSWLTHAISAVITGGAAFIFGKRTREVNDDSVEISNARDVIAEWRSLKEVHQMESEKRSSEIDALKREMRAQEEECRRRDAKTAADLNTANLKISTLRLELEQEKIKTERLSQKVMKYDIRDSHKEVLPTNPDKGMG